MNGDNGLTLSPSRQARRPWSMNLAAPAKSPCPEKRTRYFSWSTRKVTPSKCCPRNGTSSCSGSWIDRRTGLAKRSDRVLPQETTNGRCKTRRSCALSTLGFPVTPSQLWHEGRSRDFTLWATETLHITCGIIAPQEILLGFPRTAVCATQLPWEAGRGPEAPMLLAGLQQTQTWKASQTRPLALPPSERTGAFKSQQQGNTWTTGEYLQKGRVPPASIYVQRAAHNFPKMVFVSPVRYTIGKLRRTPPVISGGESWSLFAFIPAGQLCQRMPLSPKTMTEIARCSSPQETKPASRPACGERPHGQPVLLQDCRSLLRKTKRSLSPPPPR